MASLELPLSKEEINLMEQAGYSNKAIRFYKNQVNVGKLTRPDAVSTFFGPCGDLVRLYLKIEKNTIKDARFFYLGCPGAAAATSAMTVLAIGKTLEEAKKINEQDILTELGDLPIAKHDCLKLAKKTIRKTIREYEEIQNNLKNL